MVAAKWACVYPFKNNITVFNEREKVLIPKKTFMEVLRSISQKRQCGIQENKRTLGLCLLTLRTGK